MTSFGRGKLVLEKARTILRQPYTLALIAMLGIIPSFLVLEKDHRSRRVVEGVDRDRAQIYVSVKDEAAKPVPNASVQLIGGDSKVTNELGLAKLNITGNGVRQVRVSATGFKEAELSVQASPIDPNKLVVLTPTIPQPAKPDTGDRNSQPQPYVETVRSGPVESGLGGDFSSWYQLASPVAKIGYVVDSSQFTLSGDRRCNEWSECRVTNSRRQVIFSFRMQGHSEWVPPHPGVSEGILRVQYKPLSKLTNSDLRDLVIEFAGHLRSEDRSLLEAQDEVSRSQALPMNVPNPTKEQLQLMEKQLSDRKKNLSDIVSNVAQQDASLVDQYRTELLRRLGSQAKPAVEFPPIPSDVASADKFLIVNWGILDSLAHMLQ
jgi:hypothetical protein